MDNSWTIEIVETYPNAPVATALPLLDERFSGVKQVGVFKPGQPLIFVASAAMEIMRKHTASRTDIETGGLMVGKFGVHGEVEFVLVEAAIPAFKADGFGGFLRVTAEAVVEVDRVREERYPDLRVVGWYHSHPSFGIFLSPTDLETHYTAFNSGPFAAFVLDPVNGAEGVFGWQNGKVEGPLSYWLLESARQRLPEAKVTSTTVIS